MPEIVACPKCGKKYKLPDTFSTRRVRCKACGADFAAKYDPSQLSDTAVQPSLSQPKRVRKPARNASNDPLAQLGLSRIRKQPDLFADDPNAGPDPLRNHVVQDPGFASTNAAARVDQQQPQSGSPPGNLGDVVSNPFMSDTGAGSVDARRKKALKRRKEDELLAAYKTSTDSLKSDRRPSELSQNGINRTSFWVAHFVVNTVLAIIKRSSNALSGMELSVPSGESSSPESVMAIGVMLLLAVFGGFAVAGCFYAITTRLRFQNIRFKNPLWKKIATYLAAAPSVCWALATLVFIVLILSKVMFFLYVAALLAVIGLIVLIPSAIAQTAALALPPDFGVHKKLDVPAYIWIALALLPLLILTLASAYIAIALLGTYVF